MSGNFFLVEKWEFKADTMTWCNSYKFMQMMSWQMILSVYLHSFSLKVHSTTVSDYKIVFSHFHWCTVLCGFVSVFGCLQQTGLCLWSLLCNKIWLFCTYATCTVLTVNWLGENKENFYTKLVVFGHILRIGNWVVGSREVVEMEWKGLKHLIYYIFVWMWRRSCYWGFQRIVE